MKDILKEEVAKNNNIKLLRFWEPDFKNLNFIKDKIVSYCL
jgi:hypothetical protein